MEADEKTYDGGVVVLVPAGGDPIHLASSEPAHLTLIYLGDDASTLDREPLLQQVREYAAKLGHVTVPVASRGTLGDDDADVVFLEKTEAILALRDGLLEPGAVRDAHDSVEQFPSWTPHVTLGYPETPAYGEYEETAVTFETIGLWLGGAREDFPLTGSESDDPPVDIDQQSVTAGASFDIAGVIADVEEPIPYDRPEDDEDLVTEIPVHGVLAVEGVTTGDARRFSPGAVSSRNLPIPLRYEIFGSHGGNTSVVVTVGRVDEVWREGSEIRWRGVISMMARYSAEVLQGLVDRTIRGVSIDGDNAVAAVGGDDVTEFSEIRSAALTIVAIPAYQECYVELGHEFQSDLSDEQKAEQDAILADCGCGELEEGDVDRADENSLTAGATFAPGTKDGPGWITHPVPTSRLRRYWVSGEGAAKIAWGTPGDFYRCRDLLRKYVQRPDWLAGMCANLHKEATGTWPGPRGVKAGAMVASAVPAAPSVRMVEDGFDADAELESLTAAASRTQKVYPSEWFSQPNLTEPTPLTVDVETGRVFGHLAIWGTCHIGIPGVCTTAPASRSDYRFFKGGVVDTDEGPIRVGKLTSGVGHPSPRLRAAAATAHYDKPESVRAFVNVGEDSVGIWYSGVLAPWLSQKEIDMFRMVGTLSGDWRDAEGSLELVAAVAVSQPGFVIPKFALDAGKQISLTAGGSFSVETETAEQITARIGKAAVEAYIVKQERERRLSSARAQLRSFRLAAVRDTLKED